MNPAQIAREISRRNKQFVGATKAQKRVLIAKDVIKQLKAEKFQASRGNFLEMASLTGSDHRASLDIKDDDSIREIFLARQEPCQCCGLGALMMSCTLFNNKEEVKDYSNHFSQLGQALRDKRPLSNKFDKIFSKSQIELIENAFEKGSGFFRGTMNIYANDEFLYTHASKVSERNKAISFGSRGDLEFDDKKRLIAIMRNIIKNNGTFKPYFS